MYRIAVVTPEAESDAMSRQLLAVRGPAARLEALDPGSLRATAVEGSCRVTAGRADVRWDALILRRLSRDVSQDAQFELLALLEGEGVLLVNRPAALEAAESKLLTTAALARAGIPVPSTVVTGDPGEALEAVLEFGEAVIKPLYGALGAGLERVDASVGPERLAELLEANGVLYVQEYLPEGAADVRALVVGGRVIAAVRRVAAEGEWRANIQRGGRAVPLTLLEPLGRLAVRATEVLGLDYAGVDLILREGGPVVVELNGAPGWLGLQAATGCDVAAEVVRHVVSRLDARRGLAAAA